MASRVRTRISFGAFANLKNNMQQQIGLNTLITSIKNIISTFNNNFTYIVNSFNALMQFKYKMDYLVTLDKEKQEKENITENIDIEELLEKLKVIKTRLENLEKVFRDGSYKVLVPARIEFYIKDYLIQPVNGTYNYKKAYLVWHPQYNYNKKLSFIKNLNDSKLLYEIGYETMCGVMIEVGGSMSAPGFRPGYIQGETINTGIRYNLGNYKFYSNEIKVIKNSITDIELGTLKLYQGYDPGSNKLGINENGYMIVAMRLYGDENFEGCRELKNGETIKL